MTQDHLTQLRIQIIKHLALSHDSKKIFSFLNKCGISGISEEEKKVTIGVGNEFVLMQVRKFFLEGLTAAVKECYNDHYEIEIKIDTSLVGVELKGSLEEKAPKPQSNNAANGLPGAGGGTVSYQGSQGRSMGSSDAERVYKTHKQTLTDQFGVLFDTKFQFDNFVVGPNNEFAYVILQAICQQPGLIHNPFFLHGNVGLGKTHLLQATGNQIMNSFPEKTVVYLPTSKLVTEIIEGIKNNTVNKLLRKFDDVDVLILDDIQIIANKNACQDILLGLFNDFVDKKKQVIFSGDKPPRHLQNIEDRLKTRFALGTLCEITLPDFETRMAILSQKRSAKGESLLQEGIELIAETITDNVRELEGITNTLITKKQMLGRELIMDDVSGLLRSMGYEHRGQVTSGQLPATSRKKKNKDEEFDTMVERIAEYYGLEKEEIIGESRKKEVAVTRQMCMSIAKKQFGRTLEKIGGYFNKNHSSVIYSLEKFEELLREDSVIQEDWKALGMG